MTKDQDLNSVLKSKDFRELTSAELRQSLGKFFHDPELLKEELTPAQIKEIRKDVRKKGN